MAAAVERYVTSVRELSESLGNITGFCSLIHSSLDDLVKSPTLLLDNALETLAPQQHALGILGILMAKYQQLLSVEPGKKYINVEATDLNKLLSQTETFVKTCNGEQVRCAVDSFNELLTHMTNLLIESKQASRGILIASAAVEKIRMHDTQLTGVHTNMCHLCLYAKNFLPALPYLDTDITDIQKAAGQVSCDSMAFLLYFYYGGMIYAAVKNFKRALYFFEVVISTPASAISSVMVEAYKKFILVHLIYKRTDPVPPKFVSLVITRYIKSMASAYHELASAFISSNQEQLQSVVEKHRSIYQQDKNYGLVKQCVIALYKKNIQKLTKTFITLSLVDVAHRVHLRNSEEAEKYVLDMIEDGEIYATINKADGMVEFHDNPERYNNPQMLAFLQKQENNCMMLNSKLKEMERIISVTPDYVSKVSTYHSEEDSTSKPSTSAMNG